VNTEKVGRGICFVAAAALVAAGCGQPTETTRDNRRLLDAVLTAVVIRNPEELAKDKQLLDAREQAGLLSDESYSKILGIIELAEAGDWPAAEEQLYELREQVPFPK
jgi:hypothetical protein